MLLLLFSQVLAQFQAVSLYNSTECAGPALTAILGPGLNCLPLNCTAGLATTCPPTSATFRNALGKVYPYVLVSTFQGDCSDENIQNSLAVLANGSCFSAPTGSTSFKISLTSGTVSMLTFNEANCGGVASTSSFSTQQVNTCIKNSGSPSIKVDLVNLNVSSAYKQWSGWLLLLLAFLW